MDFKNAYTYLFNGITDFTRKLEKENIEKIDVKTESILLNLKQLQLETENMLINSKEE